MLYYRRMTEAWDRLRAIVDTHLPENSPRRKVLQIIAIVLLFEGLSVLVLFSYFGAILGLASIAIGLSVMTLLHRPGEYSEEPDAPIGLRALPRLCSVLGGDAVVMSLGFLVIALVVVFNTYISSRSEYGDTDTITLLFGSMLVAYPIASRRAPVEAAFALLFLGCVFFFLAAPLAVTALTGGGDSSDVGSWYVHYMLAAPFAVALDLLGIPSSSYGNIVTIQFQDGSLHSLSISTYCAGLYSFSIFLAAFVAFVLIYEKMVPRKLVVVLLLGLASAYLGNLLRMILIGVIGYYEGIDALLWAHRNIGWMIFLGWSAVFWWLIIKYTQSENTAHEDGDGAESKDSQD
jgi:archaeosortase C (PEF-CTERM variant)